MKQWSSLGSLLVTVVALASCPFICLAVALLELAERHPAYHFFPLPIAVMLWLAVQNLRSTPTLVDLKQYIASAPLLYLAHLAMAAAAGVLGSPFLCGLAFWLSVVWFARAFDFGDTSREAGLRFLPVLALFLVPPPMGLDFQFQDALASITAKLSHPWLDLLGVFHAREGVVFVTPFKRFFVDDACSGSNSFLTMSCMAVSASALFGCTGFHALLSMITAMLGSVAVNVSRIVLVVYAQRWGWELEKGWAHEVLGQVMFLGGLAVVLSAHFGWAFILHQSASRTNPATAEQVNPPTAHTSRLAKLTLTLFLILSPIFGAAVTYRSMPLILTVWRGQTSAAEIPDLALETPPEVANWKRETDAPTQDEVMGELGVRNLVWRYRSGNRIGYIGASYPFTGFHDTRVCYRNSGWEIRNTQDLALADSQIPGVRLLDMHHTGSMRRATLGLLLLSLDGRMLPFPADEKSVGGQEKLANRILGSVASEKNDPKETTVVVQFLLPISAGGNNDDAQIAEVLKLLSLEMGARLQRSTQNTNP